MWWVAQTLQWEYDGQLVYLAAFPESLEFLHQGRQAPFESLESLISLTRQIKQMLQQIGRIIYSGHSRSS